MRDPVRVPQEHIRDLWHEAKPHVEKALSAGRFPYLAEDVFAACRDGLATLYLTKGDDASTTGCFVLRLEPKWGRQELYVWICAHDDPGRSVVEHQDWLARITRAAGCSRWCGDSPRPFHRLVPGLTLESYHFVMEV
jgi:hypothetical protein